MEKKIVSTDVAIIGGGTIGLFIYTQLKKKFKEIKVLERGNTNPSINLNNDDIIIKGLFHRGTLTKRAFGLGGNSSLWGGQLAEFSQQEIKNFSSDLGLKKNELNKLYKRLYQKLQVKKSNSTQYLKKNNIKFPSKYNLKYIFTNWLIEPNFANLFNKNISKNYKDFIFKAEAKEIKLRNKKVDSIKFIKNGKIHILKAKIFIFACGTVETNKFFLKNKKIFGLNQIGKYFNDHLGIYIGNVNIINKKKFKDLFFNGSFNKSRYQPKLFFQSTNQKYNLSASGEFKFFSRSQKLFYEMKKNLINFFYYKKLKYLLNVFNPIILLNTRIIETFISFLFTKKYSPLYDQGIKFYIQSEQVSLKSSSIFYNKKKQKFFIDWKIEGAELYFIKKFANKVKDYLEAEKIATLNIQKFNKIDLKEFKKKIRDTNHPSGGMIISNYKKKGVVNNDLRVWGTKNLYIAGSSLFKRSSYANITFTSLALALKLTDSLKKNV